MTPNPILDWLDGELRTFPDRKSGEELYRFLARQTRTIAHDSRVDLVAALVHWLDMRSEPQTMLAMDLAVEHRLSEFQEPLEQLLDAVESGTAFRTPLRSYYEQRIEDALRSLRDEHEKGEAHH